MLRSIMLALVCLAAGSLGAVILFPRDYPGKVDGALHEILVVHRDGTQSMAVRVTPAVAGAAPRSLAWIIPVYGPRTAFRLLDDAPFTQGSDLHDGLLHLAAEQWAARTDFTIGTQPDQAGSSAPAQSAPPAGPCVIAASSVTGRAAVDELNAWLDANGYAGLAPAAWDWRGEEVSFVWVHAKSPALQDGRVGLPVVHIDFETDSVVVPLRHAAAQGEIELSLSIVSDKALDFDQLAIMRARVGYAPADRVPLHNLWTQQPLPPLLAPMAGASEPRRWFVNRMNVGLVKGEPPLASWPDEMTFPAGDLEDELPGFWYYADRDISLPERVFREHALAIFVGGSIAIFALVVFKGRQNRRRAMAGHHLAGWTSAGVRRGNAPTDSAETTRPSKHP